MSDIPAEVTNRLADYLIDRYGLDEAMRLIPFYFGRTEFGDDKYGRPLLPFDGRNTLRDALDEVTDLSQYLMKRVMENEAIADLLEQAATRIEPHYGHTPEDVNGHPHPRVCVECTENMYTEDGEENWTDEQVEYWLSMDPVATELRQTAAKLRADCERSVPVGNSSKNSNSPEIPDGCLFGDECCAILGPAERSVPVGHEAALVSGGYKPPVEGTVAPNYQCHGCGEFTATYTDGHRDVCDKCVVRLHYKKFAPSPAEQLAQMEGES